MIAGGYQTGVLGMRALARRGVRVVAVECEANRHFPGFRTVHGITYAGPDPDRDPGSWLEFMVRLAGTLGGRPALIASADQFVTAIARHALDLEKHFLLSPGAGLQGALATKESQYALAERHGMPLPHYRTVNAVEEVRAFAATARFPCVLKPLHFREWQAFPEGHLLAHEKVAIARSAADLIGFWEQASAVSRSAIVQEIVPGPDTAKRVYVACYDRRGIRTGHAIFRALRCDPAGFGPATVSEPVEDPEAEATADEWLRAMGYSGPCEVEMKRDRRDSRVKLIEVNPRLTGGGDAAPYAGIDVCWLHYLDLIGRAVTPVEPTGRHFRHVVLRSDLRAVLTYRALGLLRWREVLQSYRGRLVFYDLDPRDFSYSARTLFVALKAAVAGLLRPALPRGLNREELTVLLRDQQRPT